MLDWSSHTPYSDPGKHRGLLRQLPDNVDAICAAARNVIGHYRAELADLPDERREEINSRWLDLDHVIVEYWDRTRWRRTDPEQLRGVLPFDPADMLNPTLWNTAQAGSAPLSKACLI